MEEYLRPMTKPFLEKILDQMNSFYIIKEINGSYDIGFFCYIKYQNKNIPVVIINRYIKNDEEYDKTIKINIKNKSKIIKLGETRYKNLKNNVTIIEIVENKKDNIYFTELDDNLYKDEFEENYYKKPIYIIQMNNIKDISSSYGLIYNTKNSQFICSSNIKLNYNISYIFNLSNNKLIGIKGKKSKYFIYGIFLKFLINGFISHYKYRSKPNKITNIKNEINILINIDKDDLDKDIYFLNFFK